VVPEAPEAPELPEDEVPEPDAPLEPLAPELPEGSFFFLVADDPVVPDAPDEPDDPLVAESLALGAPEPALPAEEVWAVATPVLNAEMKRAAKSLFI
jgi:hypothetical protein